MLDATVSPDGSLTVSGYGSNTIMPFDSSLEGDLTVENISSAKALNSTLKDYLLQDFSED